MYRVCKNCDINLEMQQNRNSNCIKFDSQTNCETQFRDAWLSYVEKCDSSPNVFNITIDMHYKDSVMQLFENWNISRRGKLNVNSAR